MGITGAIYHIRLRREKPLNRAARSFWHIPYWSTVPLNRTHIHTSLWKPLLRDIPLWSMLKISANAWLHLRLYTRYKPLLYALFQFQSDAGWINFRLSYSILIIQYLPACVCCCFTSAGFHFENCRRFVSFREIGIIINKLEVTD